MGQKKSRTPGKRKSLNRALIVETAMSMADRDGLEALSMRRLGAELGVEAMSLYNFIEGKEDLLNALVDRAVQEVELPSPKPSQWKSAMRKRALSTRQMLLRHPWAATLIESRPDPGSERLDYYDSLIGMFRKAGFSLKHAPRCLLLLDSYIYGFALQEDSWPLDSQETMGDAARRYAENTTLENHRYLEELVTEYAMKNQYDPDADFLFGLELILDGMEKYRKK